MMCGYNSLVLFCVSLSTSAPSQSTLSRHTFSNLCLLMCPSLLSNRIFPIVITIQCPSHFIFSMTDLSGREKMQLVRLNQFMNLVASRRSSFSIGTKKIANSY